MYKCWQWRNETWNIFERSITLTYGGEQLLDRWWCSYLKATFLKVISTAVRILASKLGRLLRIVNTSPGFSTCIYICRNINRLIDSKYTSFYKYTTELTIMVNCHWMFKFNIHMLLMCPNTLILKTFTMKKLWMEFMKKCCHDGIGQDSKWVSAHWNTKTHIRMNIPSHYMDNFLPYG